MRAATDQAEPLDLQVDLKVYGGRVGTTGYTIKDVAWRSGFSPATLRYYEEIGLLPDPDRTPSGYRLYDDATLERLAFIGRAKQLGCTLDQIGDLLSAWDGGRCGPVQDRLRHVVADKLARAQEQIVELLTLTGDLQRAASALERHRPDGACDDRCGCIADPADDGAATPQSASLPAKARTDAAPIACTLGTGALRGRLADWQALLAEVDRREPIANGVRLTFASTAPAADLMRLTAAEQDCCQFFAFAITVDTRGIALEVTAPAEASPIVESLFGAAA